MKTSTRVIAFNFSTDVLVNIHIPKAGGSYFESDILPYIPSPFPCVPRSKSEKFSSKPGTMRCYRVTEKSSEWLWSRNSGFGWRCGVHAGFSEFLNCFRYVPHVLVLPPGKVWFITIMRHPIDRLISEFAQTHAGQKYWPVGRFRTCPEYMVSRVNSDPNGSNYNVGWGSFPSSREGEVQAAKALAMTYMADAKSEGQHHHRQTRMLFAPPVSCLGHIQVVEHVQRLYTTMLKSAQEVIKQQRVLVGIFEHMQRTLVYFGNQLGVKLEHLASSFRRPPSYNLPPLLLLRLTELEYLDMNLYRLANTSLFARTNGSILS